MIPQSLKTWFVIHFIADYVFAIPLLFFPETFLGYFGWTAYDPIATKLVASALFAIGGISLLHRNASREVMKTMLSLKLIWSGSVIIGLLLVFTTASGLLWNLVFSTFLVFFLLWGYYYKRLK